jgi:hypothetical protein
MTTRTPLDDLRIAIERASVAIRNLLQAGRPDDHEEDGTEITWPAAPSAHTRCPSCDAPEPRLHPATQAEGEVAVICPDPYHNAPAIRTCACTHPDSVHEPTTKRRACTVHTGPTAEPCPCPGFTEGATP